jgi:4-amino-4-deoxy-L-arabinose transferase-like glycosyltransferase
MVRKSIITLLAILLLGFAIRVYKITEMPLYGDELTMVYDTYSILKTGKDATGQSFPITFRMGAGRTGGYIYGSIPFVYIFGPGAWGVRGLSLLSGLGIIVLMYFLGKRLFNEKVGLIASFLAAISPWEIYLSRTGFEAHFALFLALLGVVTFFNKKYVVTALVWGLALLTYPTFKLTLPMMFFVLLWYTGIKNVIRNKLFVLSIVILAIFGGVVIRETIRGGSEQRFFAINVFSDATLKEQIIQKVNNDRTISLLPNFFKPIFYNRPLEYARTVFENYMDNISMRFLFLRGDGNPRNNPGEWGMLYLVDSLLLLAGLVYLWKSRELKLLVIWILIVPLATMIIANAHGLRSDLMLPPLILISSYAISKFSKVLKVLSIGAMLIQLVFILVAVYFLAPAKFASFWSTDAKAASLLAIENKDKNKTIVLSTKVDNMEYAYPVYAKIDPNLVIAQYGRFPKVYGDIEIDQQP